MLIYQHSVNKLRNIAVCSPTKEGAQIEDCETYAHEAVILLQNKRSHLSSGYFVFSCCDVEQMHDFSMLYWQNCNA